MNAIDEFHAALNRSLDSKTFSSSHGGYIDIRQPFRLYIDGGSTSASAVSFPLSEAGKNTLLEACQPASFGKGSEEVLDPEYRRALKLDGNRFFSNLDLSETDLLHGIKDALGLDNGIILTAVKDKLNVYNPGGFFRDHKDTPRGNDVVGTLVVVLPNDFEGGELVVKNGEPAIFDWPDKTRLQYAAFFSDSMHEILEVKSGIRVSLAYNLVAIPIAARPHIQFPPVTANLKSLIELPELASGTIGYHCQHMYPTSEEDPEISQACLKGRDAAFMMSAKALGLKATIYSVWDLNSQLTEDFDSDNGFAPSKKVKTDDRASDADLAWKQAKAAGFILSKTWFTEQGGYGVLGERTSCKETLQESGVVVQPQETPDWINERALKTAKKGMVLPCYGNEPQVDAFYHTAAIVVEVPKSGAVAFSQ